MHGPMNVKYAPLKFRASAKFPRIGQPQAVKFEPYFSSVKNTLIVSAYSYHLPIDSEGAYHTNE